MTRLFFIFLTAFVMDNLIVYFLPIQPIYEYYIVIPNVLLTSLVLFCFYDRNDYILGIAAILGLMYDICYADLLGLYLFVFILVVYLVKRYMINLMPVNLLSILGLMNICIVIKEGIVYFIVQTLKGTNLMMSEFATTVLVPTLLVNLIIVTITYFVLKPQFRQVMRS